MIVIAPNEMHPHLLSSEHIIANPPIPYIERRAAVVDDFILFWSASDAALHALIGAAGKWRCMPY